MTRACVHCGHELTDRDVRFCSIGCGRPLPTFYAAHGGAGASLLAGLFGVDGGHWSTIDPAAVPRRHLPVLVGRTHLVGLEAIQQALGSLGGLFELVVFNRDSPGRMPKPLTDRAYIITGTANATITCPFVAAWRADPTDTTAKDATAFITRFRNHYANSLENS
ncbi:hypothetical protein ACIRCZ_18645 [Leifsonia sp. NPDC102414]|uniref:hypothetical protein n=1 Tax=Leifsonia sp. NPDC102414 TaxID=3364124 RepID=UPI003808C6C6